jgi:16S rRNA processing protein RimM
MAGDATGISAGRVGRPHGLDGSCHVTHPTSRLLTLGMAASVAGQRREIVRRAGTEANPIVRFQGIEDREAAERLRGQEILVERDDMPELEEGEFWAHELEGCAVFAVAGEGASGERVLGVVRRLIELPSCEALELEPRGGGDVLLVPMVKDAVRDVDVRRRRIEVDAAFLDLAAPAPGDAD